jgi:hypothetical protein
MKVYLEFEVEIDVMTYHPSKPAYTSGLPEDCHDGEDELIEFEARYKGLDITDMLDKEQIEDIEENIRQEYLMSL